MPKNPSFTSVAPRIMVPRPDDARVPRLIVSSSRRVDPPTSPGFSLVEKSAERLLVAVASRSGQRFSASGQSRP